MTGFCTRPCFIFYDGYDCPLFLNFNFMKFVKIIFYIFVVVEFSSCLSTEMLPSFLNVKSEPGKCYHSFMMNDQSSKINFEEAFVLEIENPIYKNIEVTYSAKELEDVLKGKENFTIKTKQTSTKFLFKNDDFHHYTREENPVGYMICKVEVPAEYRSFQKQDLHQYKDGVTFIKKKLVKSSQVKKKYVSRKPKNLTSLQLYFPKGNWSKLREAISASHCPTTTIISSIQLKLNELGYDIEVNNFFDEKTKAAITDFQQKNNLKAGQINPETMQLLGVKY